MPTTVADLNAKLSLDSTNFVAGMLASDAELKKMSGSTAGALEGVQKLTIGLGALAGGVLVDAVKKATDWQTQLVHIQSNTGMTAQQIAVMSDAVKNMSAATGAPLQQLADGFMKIHNFGFSAAESMQILKPAMESALSTGDDVAKVGSTLAVVMHEFHLGVDQASNSMNVLHTAAQLGNTTLGDFVDSTTKAFNMAGGFHLRLVDVSAALATLTESGQTARMASDGLSASITAFVRPTAAAQAEVRNLSKLTGIDLVRDFSASGFASRGLMNSITDVHAAMAKMGHETANQRQMLTDYAAELTKTGTISDTAFTAKMTAMATKIGDPNAALLALFPNIRAFREMMLLTGSQADSLGKNFATLSDTAAGKLNPTLTGFAAQQASVAGQMQKLSATVNVLLIDLGTALLPVISQLLTAVSPVITRIADWVKGHQQLSVSILAVTAGAGALALAIGPIAALIGAIVSPIGLVIAAGALLYEAWIHDFGGIQEKVHGVVTFLTPAFNQVRAAVEDVVKVFQMKGLSAAATEAITNAQHLLGALGNWMSGTALPYIGSHLGEWVKAYWEWLGKVWPPLLTKLGDLLGQLGNWITGPAAAAVGNKLGEWASRFGAWVAPAVTQFLKEWPSNLSKILDTIFKAAGDILGKLGSWADAFVAWLHKYDVPGKVVTASLAISAALLLFITETTVTLGKKLVEWANVLWQWVKGQDVFGSLKRALETLGSDIVAFITGPMARQVAQAAKDMGGSIVSGVVEGLKDAPGAAASGITGLFGKMGNAANDAIKRGSPSRVYQEMGRDMVAGLVLGLQQGEGSAVAATNHLMQQVTKASQGVTQGEASAAAASAYAAVLDKANTSAKQQIEYQQQIAAIQKRDYGDWSKEIADLAALRARYANDAKVAAAELAAKRASDHVAHLAQIAAAHKADLEAIAAGKQQTADAFAAYVEGLHGVAKAQEQARADSLRYIADVAKVRADDFGKASQEYRDLGRLQGDYLVQQNRDAQALKTLQAQITEAHRAELAKQAADLKAARDKAHGEDLSAIFQSAEKRSDAFAADIAGFTGLDLLRARVKLHTLEYEAAIDEARSKYAHNAIGLATQIGTLQGHYDAQRLTDAQNITKQVADDAALRTQHAAELKAAAAAAHTTHLANIAVVVAKHQQMYDAMTVQAGKLVDTFTLATATAATRMKDIFSGVGQSGVVAHQQGLVQPLGTGPTTNQQYAANAALSQQIATGGTPSTTTLTAQLAVHQQILNVHTQTTAQLAQHRALVAQLTTQATALKTEIAGINTEQTHVLDGLRMQTQVTAVLQKSLSDASTMADLKAVRDQQHTANLAAEQTAAEQGNALQLAYLKGQDRALSLDFQRESVLLGQVDATQRQVDASQRVLDSAQKHLTTLRDQLSVAKDQAITAQENLASLQDSQAAQNQITAIKDPYNQAHRAAMDQILQLTIQTGTTQRTLQDQVTEAQQAGNRALVQQLQDQMVQVRDAFQAQLDQIHQLDQARSDSYQAQLQQIQDEQQKDQQAKALVAAQDALTKAQQRQTDLQNQVAAAASAVTAAQATNAADVAAHTAAVATKKAADAQYAAQAQQAATATAALMAKYAADQVERTNAQTQLLTVQRDIVLAGITTISTAQTAAHNLRMSQIAQQTAALAQQATAAARPATTTSTGAPGGGIVYGAPPSGSTSQAPISPAGGTGAPTTQTIQIYMDGKLISAAVAQSLGLDQWLRLNMSA